MKKNLMLIFLMCFVQALQAQDNATVVQRGVPAKVVGSEKPYKIVYDHAAETITLLNQKGKEVQKWEEQTTFSPIAPLLQVPPNRPVEVVVQNANAFLYAYSVNHAIAKQSNIRSCKELGQMFTSNVVSGFLPVPSSTLNFQPPSLPDNVLVGASRPVAIVPPPPPSLEGDLDFRGELELDEIESALGQIELEGALANYVSTANQLERLVESMDDQILTIALRGETEPIIPLLETLLTNIQRSLPRDSDIQDPILGASKSLAATKQAISPTLQKLTLLRSTLAASEEEALFNRVNEMIYEVNQADYLIEDSIEALNEYVYKIRKAKALAVQSFAMPPSSDYQNIAIIVEDSDTLIDSESIPHYKDGNIILYTQAEEKLACQVSLGASFMKTVPQFDLDVENRLIAANNVDEPRAGASLFFHVYPSRKPTLGLAFGLGLGDATNRPDFFVGGSFQLFAPLLINAGVVWQYQQALPNGLKLGDTVTDDFLIGQILTEDVGKKYLPGFFVGVTYGMR